MRLLLPLLFLCVFAAAVSAAPSIDQPFAELKLSDGRVLRNARLRSFNSDSIFVKCDDGILQLPYRAFPADLQPQLAQARAKALAADSASAPPPNPPAPPVAPGFRPAPPRPSAYQMSQDEMERLALAKEKANEWARQHFHYNALMLSMNVRINDISLQLSEPRRVSLRAPIYQVNGRILMACSDVGSGRDLDPRETLFSVTLEVDAVGRIAVIDSSEKPGDQSEEHKR
ncbi:MAG TPA: hypothetical protein VFB27_14685, partial [Opitutaceae bacterium]|nr:hypothetical protein [Opitutaceae bacterium]